MNEQQIARLVETFYAKVRSDAMLGPIFEGAIGDHWDTHLATMRTFWSSVMLGSSAYKGNPMAAHLRLPLLSASHFEHWLSLWRETAFQVAGDHGFLFVRRAESIAARLQSAVSSVQIAPAPTEPRA
ncbi:MAG: group III truncated hemoglobin [Bryobacteraceae bacterium]